MRMLQNVTLNTVVCKYDKRICDNCNRTIYKTEDGHVEIRNDHPYTKIYYHTKDCNNAEGYAYVDLCSKKCLIEFLNRKLEGIEIDGIGVYNVKFRDAVIDEDTIYIADESQISYK